MLKDIRIQGTFGHRDSYFDFKDGLTAITGRNGKGKSMIQEMIQFAYWGIAALRGKSDDYPELKVWHRCWIKGQPYTIERSITKAALYLGHETDKKQLATGTKAVNVAVKELFGYSMAVFQVANAVNQKQVDEFCKMLPTARKKLVDETIGLSALDDLTKWIGENELGIRSRLNARSELMREPVEPVRPEGYLPMVELDALLAPMLAQQRVRTQHEVVASQIIYEPPLVELEPDDSEFDALKAKSAEYQALVTEAQLLQKDIDALPAIIPFKEMVLEADDDKLEEYRKTVETRAVLTSQKGALVTQWQRIPESTYTMEQLLAMEDTHRMIGRWVTRQALIEAGIAYHCENCDHDGHMLDPRLNSPEFAGVPDVCPEHPALAPTGINAAKEIASAQPRREELNQQLRALEEELLALPDTAQRIGIIEATRREIIAQANAKRTKERHDELMAKRTDLGNRLIACPNKAADVARIEVKRQRYSEYKITLEIYKTQHEKIAAAKAELTKFAPDLDQQVLTAHTAKNQSLVYETNLLHYNEAKKGYDKLVIEQGELQVELEDWGKAKQAVTDLRTKIKGYLLPSLNKVASYLLGEFTGGELSWIVINDDFEVIVDGKRVETLSGGQKTVANLAIRIGLGQVLTNQVFPVLMLDEPDESCDDVVAGLIEKTLGVLKTKMKQILLVTHKTGTDADHRIHLE